MEARPASPDPADPADPAVTLAAVALSGRALRYAEVERTGRRQALRRLGTCDFDFAVDEAVLGLTGPSHLDTVAEALREIFRGTPARSLLVAVHPPALPGFFAPLPATLAAPQRYEQLRQEAALLADVSTTQPVRIRAVPVRTEVLVVGKEAEPYRWHHVLHVPEAVHARLTLLAKALGARTYDLVDSTHAAAAVVLAADAQRPAPPDDEDDGLSATLALGAYPGHVEIAVVQGGQWMHGHHGASGAPEDAAYFAAALLEYLGMSPAEVDRFFLYGEGADPARYGLLGELLDAEPALLDPLAVFGRPPSGAPPATLAAYVPCLGAVLR
jgi:hypothetical protein